MIAITGYPGSGKTTFANDLAKKSKTKVLHTDDFIKAVPFKDIPEHLIAIVKVAKPDIIEGVQVARMLRKGHRDKTFSADTVIWVEGGNEGNKISAMVAKAFEEWKKESGQKVYTIEEDEED